MILLRLGVALLGVALALTLPVADEVPGRYAGALAALAVGVVLALVAPHRCPCRRRPTVEQRPAMSNVVRLAGEPGASDCTDPGLGELRPVRRGRHASG